jgi:parallel beta-helix repeat protein
MIALIPLLIGLLSVGFSAQTRDARSTVYINADGSVDPPTANITSSDNVTYTFTSNINDSIVILRSNITVDGAGYTLNGTGTGKWAGMTIEGYGSINVTVQNVNIIGFETGIGLVSTDGNTILGCTIANNTYGIWGAETMNNTISGNAIANNSRGIFFTTVFNTVTAGNNVTHNGYGVWLEFSTGNEFYHNYFVDNTNQTYVQQGNPNTWDDGYPPDGVGGNYWSDFSSRYPCVGDTYSGPGQNITGSDGFWDGPYEVAEDNIDNYPIVPEAPTWASMLLILTVSTGVVTIYKRKLRASS